METDDEVEVRDSPVVASSSRHSSSQLRVQAVKGRKGKEERDESMTFGQQSLLLDGDLSEDLLGSGGDSDSTCDEEGSPARRKRPSPGASTTPPARSRKKHHSQLEDGEGEGPPMSPVLGGDSFGSPGHYSSMSMVLDEEEERGPSLSSSPSQPVPSSWKKPVSQLRASSSSSTSGSASSSNPFSVKAKANPKKKVFEQRMPNLVGVQPGTVDPFIGFSFQDDTAAELKSRQEPVESKFTKAGLYSPAPSRRFNFSSDDEADDYM